MVEQELGWNLKKLKILIKGSYRYNFFLIMKTWPIYQFVRFTQDFTENLIKMRTQ